MTDGLPPDPVQKEEDAKEEPHDEEAKAAPGAVDEKKGDDMKSPANEEGNNEGEKNGNAQEDIKKEAAAPFELLDDMKGRLLRFELTEGELASIPTGRNLKDDFPEDSGVVFVDQVCDLPPLLHYLTPVDEL